MDIIVVIKNVSAHDLAHLMTAEKMGLNVDIVEVVHGNESTQFNSINSAANVIIETWKIVKGFFN